MTTSYTSQLSPAGNGLWVRLTPQKGRLCEWAVVDSSYDGCTLASGLSAHADAQPRAMAVAKAITKQQRKQQRKRAAELAASQATTGISNAAIAHHAAAHGVHITEADVEKMRRQLLANFPEFAQMLARKGTP